MTKNQTLFILKKANTRIAAFTNADAANTKKLVFAPNTYDGVVRQLKATSTDGSARVCQLWMYDGVTYMPLLQISVPGGAGNSITTLPVDILKSQINGFDNFPQKDIAGNNIVEIPAGHSLWASFVSQVTAGAQISVIAFGEDY